MAAIPMCWIISTLVHGVDGNDTLTEIFTYTLTDGDGDARETTLTVTINGSDDPILISGLNVGGPELVVEDDDLPDGSHRKRALTKTGSFTVTAMTGSPRSRLVAPKSSLARRSRQPAERSRLRRFRRQPMAMRTASRSATASTQRQHRAPHWRRRKFNYRKFRGCRNRQRRIDRHRLNRCPHYRRCSDGSERYRLYCRRRIRSCNGQCHHRR